MIIILHHLCTCAKAQQCLFVLYFMGFWITLTALYMDIHTWRVGDIHEHVGMCITEVHNTAVFQGFVMSNPHNIKVI